MKSEKNILKRMAAVITSLCMAVTLLPAASFAAGETAPETAPEPSRYMGTVIPGSQFVASASTGVWKVQYTGQKIILDSPEVLDTEDRPLREGRDYSIVYDRDIVDTGKYTVTFKGINDFEGQSLVASIVVVPKWPPSVSIRLSGSSGGYDDIFCRWDKVKGASGYLVYYRKPSVSSRWYRLVYTTKNYYMKRNLRDGTKYQFRVLPYYMAPEGRYYAFHSKYSNNLYTLKRVSTPRIYKASSSKVKVRWTNIAGEWGYQTSRSTSRNGTYIVSTYKTTTGNYRYLSTKRYRTYYYKVRAYQWIRTADGTLYRVPGPWSAPRAYTLR